MKKKYLRKLIRKIISQLLILVLITNSLMSFGAFSFAQEATSTPVTPQPTPIETSTPIPTPTEIPSITSTPAPTIEPTVMPSTTITPTPVTQTTTPIPVQSVEPTSNPLQSTPTPTTTPIPQSTIDALQNYIKESSSSATLIDYAIKLPFKSSYPISLGFGEIPDDPVLQKEYESFGIIAHDGIDYELPDDTKVLASDLGIVLSAGPGIYGTTVTIYHTWGMTYYGHLSSVSVELGQIVEAGALIGYSGSTGLTTGPHLHFSVKPKNPDLKNGFHGMVDPNIYLDPKPQSEVLGISNAKKTGNNLKFFRANENPEIEFTINDKNLNYSLKDSDGKRIYPQKKITKKNSKKYFGISGVRDFRPGKYTLRMTNGDGEAEEKEFYWGVLAVNTNKSIYLPGEIAYLQMASLDEKGHTICDGKLELTINNEVLSTENGKIKYGGSCNGDNVTDSPDYYAYYQPNKTGTYQMSLKNLNNGFEINDSFEVKKSLPFEVERIGATRINPFKANYKMTIKIKANEDFDGTIKEQVPQNFQITPETGIKVETVNNINEISWDIKIKTGEVITLQYEYNAPDESPQFYLLGPIELVSSDQSVKFQEARQWQIASDANTTYLSGSGNWTSPITGNVSIECWGGGAAGGGQNLSSDGGGGGGGGAYAKKNTYAVTKNSTYAYSVGSGGTGVASSTGNSGGTTSFNTNICVALGGYGGSPSTGNPPVASNGANGASGTGDVKFGGGNGETGRDSATGKGGYGGSSAGTAAIGWSGPTTWSTVTYPTASTPTGAGYGGDGGGAGVNGSAPASGNGGGGGGSGDGTAMVGGAGANGKIIITYADNTAPTVALNTPTNGAAGQSTTPTLNFTGTDATYADNIEYNVQVDTANTFNTFSTITRDAVSSAATNPDSTTLAFSHTIGNYSNRMLIVGVELRGGKSVNNITYGAVALTKINSNQPGADNHTELWYLARPAVGTDTITITASASTTIAAGAISFYNVDPAIGVNATGGSATAGTSSSITISSETNSLVVDVIGLQSANAALAANASQTQEINKVGTADVVGMSTKAGATSISMAWTFTSDFWSGVAVNLKPSLNILLNKFSSIPDASFTAGHPFTSGTAIDYTVQAGDVLTAGITYYWRVAGIDPSGSNTWGAWSSTYSFTTSGGGPTLDQLMRHGTWFNSNVKQPFTF